jgi:hypothetical protein
MGLREEIAKVRQARSRLEITRAKLRKLDEASERLEKMLAKPDQPTMPEKADEKAEKKARGRRRGLELE